MISASAMLLCASGMDADLPPNSIVGGVLRWSSPSRAESAAVRSFTCTSSTGGR